MFREFYSNLKLNGFMLNGHVQIQVEKYLMTYYENFKNNFDYNISLRDEIKNRIGVNADKKISSLMSKTPDRARNIEFNRNIKK